MASRKGIPNKLTADLKTMIETALHKAGGRDYLVAQAEKNPAAFMALVGRLLPKDVNANMTGEMIIKVLTGTPEPHA